VTTQWDYIRRGAPTKYTTYHPDNTNKKIDNTLPAPVKYPEPSELYTELTASERTRPGVYGHKL